MAGRILLNTSGDAFRVKPQSRRHFDEQHDDGRMSGEDWMRNIGQAMDLGMKAYGVANIASQFMPGGQAVKPGAAQLAAPGVEDAVVAAQEAANAPSGIFGKVERPLGQMPQQMAAPPPPPMQMNPETHMPVGYSQHPEMAQAQAAMQQAQMYRPIESMQQSVTNPIISGMTAPQPGVFTQSSSVGVPQIQYSPFEGVSPNEIMGRMSIDGLGAQPQGIGREVGQMPQPQAPQMPQAPVDNTMQAFEAAEAAVPQKMAEFATLADAQTALAMASSSGDRQAWKAAVENMQNSPLSDVRPTNLQDAIFGTHIERAKRALIAKYPPPKAGTAMDALKAALMRARIGKFKTDDERNRAIHFLKEQKEFREGEKFELFKKRHAKEMEKLGIDIGISATELKHRAPKLLAQITRAKAGASKDFARAAETRRDTRVKRDMEDEIKIALENKAWAPARKDKEAADRRLHDKDMQSRRAKTQIKAAGARGKARAGEARYGRLVGEEVRLDTLLKGTKDYEVWVDGNTPATVRKQLEKKNGNLAKLAGVRAELKHIRSTRKGGGKPTPTPLPSSGYDPKKTWKE